MNLSLCTHVHKINMQNKKEEDELVVCVGAYVQKSTLQNYEE
jgi:hypothetical protein